MDFTARTRFLVMLAAIPICAGCEGEQDEGQDGLEHGRDLHVAQSQGELRESAAARIGRSALVREVECKA